MQPAPWNSLSSERHEYAATRTAIAAGIDSIVEAIAAVTGAREKHQRGQPTNSRGIKPKAALPKVTTHDTGSRGDGSLRAPADGPLQRSAREDVVNVAGATQRCRGRERRSTRRHPATLPS